MLSGLLAVSCHTTDAPLSLQVTQPEGNLTTDCNLLKVTGNISPPDAIVRVNNAPAIINQADATFFAYVELAEGTNNIGVTATHGDAKTTEVLSVYFEPVPWIDYKWPDLKTGPDYRETPIRIAGSVSDPDVTVLVYSVTDRDAEVPPDAVTATLNDRNFEADLLLKTGHNRVLARVEKGDLTATRSMVVSVTETGEVIYTTGKSDGTSLAWPCAYIEDIEPDISIGVGERKRYDLKLKTTPYPQTASRQQCSFKFWGAEKPYALPPKGLTASIEPTHLLAYQNTTYEVTMVIETSETIIPGTYHLRLRMTPENEKYKNNDASKITEITVME